MTALDEALRLWGQLFGAYFGHVSAPLGFGNIVRHVLEDIACSRIARRDSHLVRVLNHQSLFGDASPVKVAVLLVFECLIDAAVSVAGRLSSGTFSRLRWVLAFGVTLLLAEEVHLLGGRELAQFDQSFRGLSSGGHGGKVLNFNCLNRVRH